MRVPAIFRSAFTAAAFVLSTLAGHALAQSAGFAIAPYPKATAEEALRLPLGAAPATVVRLAPVAAAEIDAVRHANTLSALKRLQIGIGRGVETVESNDAALAWTPVAGGYAAQWQVISPEARALRVGLVAANLAPGTEIRFMGSALAKVYGPFTAADVKPRTGIYWSPVLEGDTATVEVFVALGTARADVALAIAQVSHLFASPAQADVEMQAKASGFCEVDIICRSATDAALATVGRAVARMTFSDGISGGSFLCTGTLLNPASGALTPYFYSANHCISTQASASTLTTHWFYDSAGCGTGVVSSSYVQVTGGATLLYANEPSDVLLLRLNNSPPGGATYAGWDATTLANGTALTAVHHPAGDLKKVSLGSMGGFGSYPGLSGSFIIARWNAIATGVTEGGSSGSGIFTRDGTTDYRLRGGLLGGPSSCTASSSALYDNYSRLDQAYSALAQYLNPGGGGGLCTYSIAPGSIALGAGTASGTFGVTAAGGCAWSAASNASWLTTSSSGSGNGTVSYSVAANSGATPRTGTITVGGQAFTVTQSATLATTSGNLLANPGFESGDTVWAQVPAGTILFNNASIAHAGSWYGWLGGYDNGTDTLYQDVTIPASSTGARVQFWYLITTQELTSTTVYDKMTVTLVNPATGAVLATLATFTNLNATSGWTLSPAYDVSAFRGQTVRLRFIAVTDESLISSFRVDDVSLSADVTAGTTNYTAMWWNAQESGWGFNVNHQGDIIFATLFTYDSSGNPMWLVLARGDRQGTGSTYSGQLYRTTGSPFNAVPFVSADAVPVGTMTVNFTGASDATLSYNVNGVTVNKTIIKEVFGTRSAECVGTTASRTSATNYTDMWWNSSESGWGVNVTQQGDVIFATLFTYAADRQGVWYVLANAPRQGDGSYFGDLYRTTGPAFNAAPFNPGAVNAVPVGTMRFRFTSGTTATLEYTVNGVSVTKQIIRQVFSSPLPICF
jgi:hypothetical protein